MYDKGAKYFNLYFLKMVLNKIVLYIVSCLNKYLNSVLILQNDMIILNLDLRKRGSLINAVHFLRDHNLLKFDSLLDIWGVDYPEREERFEVNYMLNSSIYMRRIWLKLSTSSNGSVDSVVGLFNSAGWLEREVWDMYGVYFVNNPDLRRILTDYGFEGYPLRKDFPLSGFTEVRYDDGEKRVISEKVELAQDYRYFSFLNPW